MREAAVACCSTVDVCKQVTDIFFIPVLLPAGDKTAITYQVLGTIVIISSKILKMTFHTQKQRKQKRTERYRLLSEPNSHVR
jgi:hypothetical protein